MQNEHLLEINDLKKYFPVTKGMLKRVTGYVHAVDDVSLYVDSGETLGIVGESGCGKTTLGKCIVRLNTPTAGKIMLRSEDGTLEDLMHLPRRESFRARRRIQMIFQDPYASLNPAKNIWTTFDEPLRIHGFGNRKKRLEIASNMMEAVNLHPEYLFRYPHEFSGGQRQRICIARSLAMSPELIVCDEPVSALDVSIQAQIMNLMRRLQKEFSLTYIFIAHDLSVVEYMSNRIAVMYLGKIFETAPAKNFSKHCLHPYAQALMSAVPIPVPDAEKEEIILTGDVPSPIRPPEGCRFHPRCSYCMGNGKTHPVVMAFSPDGVHWEHRPDFVANPYTSDALNKLYYNPIKEEYVLLHRSAFVDRRISVRTSKDMSKWSDPHIILQPGPHYNDNSTGMQHYSMTAGWFDGVFYGLVWRFNTCLYDLQYSRMWGYMEPELVYGYDGDEFLYTSGKTLIERPYPPLPGCAGISAHDICESADGQSYFILTNGTQFFHGTQETNKALSEKLGIKGGLSQLIYKIRKDGFCGIESVQPGGQVITKGLAIEKDDLEFNIRANCGYVRFGIMDNKGNFLRGFSYDDCIPFEYSDSVKVIPRWKEHTLSELLGKQIRIAVELNTAILHCISATAHPYIRQPMKSFGEPQGLE